MKLFHGSPQHDITEFHLDSPRFQPVEGSGVYLTNDYRLARGYAGTEGRVYEIEINTNLIFDATTNEEFNKLLEKISAQIGINISQLEFMKETIDSLVSGEYQITNQFGQGTTWQIKNLLNNDESFQSLSNAEELLQQLEQIVDLHFSTCPVLKYQDKHLGLIFLCKDPKVIKILSSVAVGTPDEASWL